MNNVGLYSGFGWLALGRTFGVGARFGTYEILTAFYKGLFIILLASYLLMSVEAMLLLLLLILVPAFDLMLLQLCEHILVYPCEWII